MLKLKLFCINELKINNLLVIPSQIKLIAIVRECPNMVV